VAKSKKKTGKQLAAGAPELISGATEACVKRAKAWRKAHPNLNREGWLNGLTDALRPLFEATGHAIPERVLVSFGFPSRGGLSRSKRTIGQCWAATVCEDGKSPHIFLHPELPAHGKSPDQPAADDVLVHELVHAAVGPGHGHRGDFRVCALSLGLEGKMTATRASKELHVFLGKLFKALGECPHKRLKPGSTKPKEKGRMLKMTCQCSSGRPIRVSRLQAERGGYHCEICDSPWVLEGEPQPGTLAEREAIWKKVVAAEGEDLDPEDIEAFVEEELETLAAEKRVTRAVEALAPLSVEELSRALERLQARPAVAAASRRS
jgi:hypothetical protein